MNLTKKISELQERNVDKAMRICRDLRLREETVSGIDEQKHILDLAKMITTDSFNAGYQAGKIQALHLLEDLYAKAEDKAELIEMFNEALQDKKQEV